MVLETFKIIISGREPYTVRNEIPVVEEELDIIDLKKGPVMTSGNSSRQNWLPGLVDVDNKLHCILICLQP